MSETPTNLLSPLLYGAINSDGFNGDEYNGPGNNWPISPYSYDSFEFVDPPPIIMNANLLAVFDGCPDLCVTRPMDTYVVPARVDTVFIRKVAA